MTAVADPATLPAATPRQSAIKAQVAAHRDRRGASQRPILDQLAGPALRGEPQSSHSGRSGGRRGDESASRQSGTGHRPSDAPGAKIDRQAQLSGGSPTTPGAGALPIGRRAAATPPAIVPGTLVRVRAGADTRFAGRSGLVVAVDAGVATIRFGGARGHSFALADLVPVVAAPGRR